MNKELKEEVIKNALLKINNKIGITVIPKIIFKKDLYEKANQEGFYNFNKNKIYIQENDDIERMEWIITHEIGHFIHWRYFKAENLQFKTYMHKGHFESFAENFTDYIFSSELFGDILNMDNYLKSKKIK